MRHSSWPNLRHFVRERILGDVVSSVSTKSAWKVLLVDTPMLSVANAVVSPYEIMEKGVALVESFRPSSQRERLPEFEAIYFICPTQNNVNLLMEDFQASSFQYSAAHVFFSAPLPDLLFDQLKTLILLLLAVSNALKKYHSNSWLLNLLSSSLPHNQPLTNSSLPLLLPSTPSLPGINSSMSELATFLSAFKLSPVIRYRKTSNGITSLCASKLASIISSLPKPKSSDVDNDVTLLIVDRGLDLEAPLIHEFSYQSVLFDLMPTATQCPSFVSFKISNEDRTVYLEDKDEFWETSKFLHVAEVSERLREIIATLPRDGGVSSDSMSIGQLRKVMTTLPGYQEQIRCLSGHLELIGKCLDQLNADKMHFTVDIEQEIVTGEDEEGRKVENLLSKVTDLLENHQLPPILVKRLILLYLVSKEKEGDVQFQLKQRLVDDFGKVPKDQQGCFAALSSFDMVNHYNAKKSRKFFKKKAHIVDDSKYAYCRFVPKFRQVIDEWVGGRLDIENFPFVNSAHVTTRKTSKLIVYFVGGVTGSELKVVHDLSLHGQVLIGATGVINAGEFVNQMDSLGK
ncbi:hypothetical protein GEMRC1_009031 [Eukaryota sp. GEM-RC1]